MTVKTLEDLTFALRGRRPGEGVGVHDPARWGRAAPCRPCSRSGASGPPSRSSRTCWRSPSVAPRPPLARAARPVRHGRPPLAIPANGTSPTCGSSRSAARTPRRTGTGRGRGSCSSRRGRRLHCDQIFTMREDGADVRLVSSGAGRTTCGFFFPDGRRLIYASTHLAGDACPPPPDRSRATSGRSTRARTSSRRTPTAATSRDSPTHDGYDAECAVSPDGRRIVFTSLRAGDLDLYVMNADGSNVTRLTDTPATTAARSSPGTAGPSSSVRRGPRPRRNWRSTAHSSPATWCGRAASTST